MQTYLGGGEPEDPGGEEARDGLQGVGHLLRGRDGRPRPPGDLSIASMKFEVFIWSGLYS